MKAELDIIKLTADILTASSSSDACEDPSAPISEGGDAPDTCGTGNLD